MAELEAWLPHLRALARSLCRQTELADELVHNTCLTASSLAPNRDRAMPMRNWLFKLLNSEYLEHRRKLVVPDPPTDGSDPGHAFERLHRMPENRKVAFLLVHAAGLSLADAGNLLSCSPDAVKQLLHDHDIAG